MFDLTAQERKAILFFTCVIFFGFTLRIAYTTNAAAKKIARLYLENCGKVDINSADKEQLIGLPGIGEKIAERIIVYRKENGTFSHLEELRNIKGITSGRLEELKRHIFVK
jgi:competence ComEA-like helix-hairpin-helix protein